MITVEEARLITDKVREEQKNQEMKQIEDAIRRSAASGEYEVIYLAPISSSIQKELEDNGFHIFNATTFNSIEWYRREKKNNE